MVTFNQYSMYTYAASEFKNSCDDKVLVDLHKLKSLKEYNEVLDYIDKSFGSFSREKFLDYSNDIKLSLYKYEDMIVVSAMQKDKQIFGQYWQLQKNE